MLKSLMASDNSFNIRKLAVILLVASVSVIPVICLKNINYGFVIPKIMVLFTLSSVLMLLINLDRDTTKKRTILSILIGFFIVSLFYSTVFSVARINSLFGNYGRFHGLLFYLFSIAFFYMGNWLSESKKIVLAATVIAGGIVGFVSIIEFWRGSARVVATLGHPIYVANYLLLTIPVILGFLFSEGKKRIKLLCLAGLAITTIGVVLTFSRAGWAGLIIMFVLFFVSLGTNCFNRKRVLAGLFAVIALALIASIILIHYQPQQVLVKSGRLHDMNKIDSRPLIWKGAWQQFLHEPFGSGLSTFPFTAAKYLPTGITDDFETNIIDQAHNELLHILANQGLFGGVVFLLIIGALVTGWVKWRRDVRRDLNLASIWTAVLVHLFVIQFSFVDISYTFLFWLMVGFLARDTFPETQRMMLSFRPNWKVAFSIPLILIAFGYGGLCYLADLEYTNWLNRKNLSFWQRNLYIERANRLAFWESHYRYHRALVAQKLLRHGEFSPDEQLKAMRLLARDNKMLLQSNPIDFKYYELTAETLILLKDYDGAIKSYRDALSFFPNNYYYLSRIGDIYTAMNKYDEAKAFYKKALSMKDGYYRAVNGLKNLRQTELK